MDRRWNKQGLSLIEVVVSMLILAIGMVAGLGMTQAGQAGVEASRQISYATELARAKMEEEASIPYRGLLEGNLEGEDTAEGFSRSWAVLPDTPRDHFLTIRVGVKWKDKTGRPHRVELVALRAQGIVP